VAVHETRGRASAGAAGAAAAAVERLRSHRWYKPGFNCTGRPLECEEPFKCQTLSPLEPLEWGWSGYAGGSGKTNPRVWCSVPDYVPYMHECLVTRDLQKAAHLQYEATQAGRFGPLTAEMDGSYCFIEGYCVDKTVSHETTLEEAEQLCDKRFGRATWTAYGSVRSPPEDQPGAGGMPNASGFANLAQTRPFVLAACAMGNYHCDIVYCKETYCKSPYYVGKYGHLLKEFGHTP